MKKKYFLILCVFVVNFSINAQTTIFSENFETVPVNSFPAGWSLFNVDGLTPDGSVPYVNNAWIVRDNFINNPTNKAAFSTSYYNPVGTANDWMMSPAIAITNNNVLSWDAFAPDPNYRDGYEVRISTTLPDISLSNSLLFSITEENTTVTNRTVDLSPFAGQTVYISWRNNSVNKFLLVVDNILITGPPIYDSGVVAESNKPEYTKIPLSQTGNLNSNVRVSNFGNAPMTNLTVTLNVTDAFSTIVHTETSATIPTLSVGTTQPITFADFTPSTTGTYTFSYVLTSTETDSQTSNNFFSYTKEIENTYARDDNNVVGQVGIGAGTSGQIGQEFEIINSTNISSVSFMISNFDGSLTNTSTYATIWSMTSAGLPNVIIAQTVPVNIITSVNNLYTANIVGGTFNLVPGTYFVALEETTLSLQICQTIDIFTAGTVKVNWPTSPYGSWANIETITSSLAKSLVIRPNFTDVLSVESYQLNLDDINLYPNPAKDKVRILNKNSLKLKNANIYDISGREVLNYKLNDNTINELDISKLTTGNYIITIKTENGMVNKKLIIN